jgi:hypothetical protein
LTLKTIEKEGIWNRLLGIYKNYGFTLEYSDADDRFKLYKDGEHLASFHSHVSIAQLHEYIEDNLV